MRMTVGETQMMIGGVDQGCMREGGKWTRAICKKDASSNLVMCSEFGGGYVRDVVRRRELA